jgi:hypothetical protein
MLEANQKGQVRDGVVLVPVADAPKGLCVRVY